MTDLVPSQTTDIHEQSLTPEVLSRDQEHDSITIKVAEKVDASDVIDSRGESRDPPPVNNVHDKAVEYLEKHNISQLFQGLTSEIVFHRPDNVIDYMINAVEKLQAQHRLKRPSPQNITRLEH